MGGLNMNWGGLKKKIRAPRETNSSPPSLKKRFAPMYLGISSWKFEAFDYDDDDNDEHDDDDDDDDDDTHTLPGALVTKVVCYFSSLPLLPICLR